MTMWARGAARITAKEWWREEHPGEPLPEYQVVRRWAINEWNECKRFPSGRNGLYTPLGGQRRVLAASPVSCCPRRCPQP